MDDQTQDLSQNDINYLNGIIQSLEEENKALKQTMIDVQARIERDTAADMQVVKDSLSELDQLEDEANAQEQQGAVAAAQQQIQSI